jgi:tetratricopeptide (TPR) repeat protein
MTLDDDVPVNPQDRIERSRLLYEAAVFGGEPDALTTADRELDAVEAALCLARGRIAHARFLEDRREDPHELDLFERAASLFHQLGDAAGEAEALFWIGTFHQVVRSDNAAAEGPLRRAADLAQSTGDRLTLSYALRHLAFTAVASNQPEEARRLMQESTTLRRDIGFLPGVAANLIGLAYLAADDGRRQEAAQLLDEATSIAEASQAHGVLRWVARARPGIGGDDRAESGDDSG